MIIKAIDLFCGAGGLTCGLKKSGINVVAGVDIEGNCKYAFEFNNHAKFIQASISNIHKSDLMDYYANSDYRVLVGCAPCQPFSTQTNKLRKQNIIDSRWYLLNEYSRIVRELQPDVVSMENVPLLAKQEIFNDFVRVLKKNEYYVEWHIVYCPKYGIPQKRRRLVLLASKLGKIRLIPPTCNNNSEYVTVRDTIYGLNELKAGQVDTTDSLHRSMNLSPKNMRRIEESLPGGTWKDWSPELLADCHKKASGKSYSSVYARMQWDSVGPTITTQFFNYGSGRYGHPEQNRAISLREGALLQTFPPEYKFWDGDNFSINQVGKMIGNAVPVRLGEVIGDSIVRHLVEIEEKNNG